MQRLWRFWGQKPRAEGARQRAPSPGYSEEVLNSGWVPKPAAPFVMPASSASSAQPEPQESAAAELLHRVYLHQAC